MSFVSKYLGEYQWCVQHLEVDNSDVRKQQHRHNLKLSFWFKKDLLLIGEQ